MEELKKCTKCGKELKKECFSKNKKNIDGLQYYCKSCVKENLIKNKDKIKEYRKQYRLNNAEKLTITRRKERQSDTAKEAALKYLTKWRNENKDKCLGYWKKYREQKRDLPKTITTEQWVECLRYFKNKCCYCGKKKKLTIDHFIPLSKGGEFSKENILCSCLSCNSSKSYKDFELWYKNYEYYNNNRMEKILNYVGGDGSK